MLLWLKQKIYVGKFKETNATSTNFSDNNGLKHRISNRNFRKPANMWKLGNMMLSNQRINKEIKTKGYIEKDDTGKL